MKTNIYDYILSTAFIFMISCFAFLISLIIYQFPIFPADFKPIASLLTFIFTYGFITVFFLFLIRKIKPFKTGKYSLEDEQFTLWKLHSVLTQLSMPCLKLIIPIFLRPVLYQLFGAKIGKQVAIGGKILDPFFTTIEDYAIIGEDAVVTSHIIAAGNFHLLKIILKKNCTIGVKSIIMPGVVIGEGSVILPGSLLTLNTKVPSSEVWGGNPAKKIKNLKNKS